MKYRILVADTTEDLFGDNPYSSWIAFDDFTSGEDALRFANLMINHGKAVAILPIREENE